MDGFEFSFSFDDDRFVAGEEFHSNDGGKTWHRGPLPPVIVAPDAPKLTVTKVDRERGIIEVA